MPDVAVLSETREFCAYYGSLEPDNDIVPAPKARDWMSGNGAFAKRCLPMVVANQAGWVLLNPHTFTAEWDGSDHADGVRVEYTGSVRPRDARVSSQFGLGIVTWSVPYLFRTPPGYNLLVRGPSNMPKDGVAALEGLVETDWSIATFTMNWKFTRPKAPVTFEAGEPYSMVVPCRRHELEALTPVARHISCDPDLHEATKRWARDRQELQVRKFLAEYTGDARSQGSWQKDYYQGRTPAGAAAPEHQHGLRLREFVSDGGRD